MKKSSPPAPSNPRSEERRVGNDVRLQGWSSDVCSSDLVSTAACLHLCAAIPNFLILEYVRTNEPWRSKLQKGDPQIAKDGYLALPESPGLGIDLDEEVLASRPFEP